jgi:hypothetical protein
MGKRCCDKPPAGKPGRQSYFRKHSVSSAAWTLLKRLMMLSIEPPAFFGRLRRRVPEEICFFKNKAAVLAPFASLAVQSLSVPWLDQPGRRSGQRPGWIPELAALVQSTPQRINQHPWTF